MTTAEKKRILSMPNLKGEIRVIDPYAGPLTFEMESHMHGSLMLTGRFDRYHFQMHDHKAEFWMSAKSKEINSLYLSAFIEYKDIQILWVIYEGTGEYSNPIPQQKAA